MDMTGAEENPSALFYCSEQLYMPCGPLKPKTAIAADEICATAGNNQRYGPDFGFEKLMEKRKSGPLAGILAVLQ